MAQVNLTLTHEEVLQVLTGDRDAAMKFLLERILTVISKVRHHSRRIPNILACDMLKKRVAIECIAREAV